MAVEYSGPNGATVTVGADENGNNSQTFTNVQTGAVLNVSLGDIGNWWYWSVNGTVEASIHTSCSDDILGNVDAGKSTFGNLGTAPDPADNDYNGTFLVVSHTDDSSNTCTLDGYTVNVPPLPVSTVCDCDGKIVAMTVIYNGPSGATITVGSDDKGNNAKTYNNVPSNAIIPVELGDIGNWWYWSVEVNGVKTVEASIHTSCSDDILGNENARKSTFGNMGNYPDPVDDNALSRNDGTFLVTSHTDDKGNTCSLNLAQ
jgi:hypothetical protein